MARPPRMPVENGRYHVTARGNERRDIFRQDRDRWHCLGLLAQLAERFGAHLHAYVLMDNHYHLVGGSKGRPAGGFSTRMDRDYPGGGESQGGEVGSVSKTAWGLGLGCGLMVARLPAPAGLSRLTKGAFGGSFTLSTRLTFGHGCDCFQLCQIQGSQSPVFLSKLVFPVD